MSNEHKELTVVSSDELVFNMIQKYVEKRNQMIDMENSDCNNQRIEAVSMPPIRWVAKKKAGEKIGKTLLTGEVMGVKKDILPIIDIKFDQYGVKYGWAGKQAVIWVDPKALAKRKVYEAFCAELKQKLSEPYKKQNKPMSTLRKRMGAVGGVVCGAAGVSLFTIGAPIIGTLAVGSMAINLVSAFGSDKEVKRQQYMYAILLFVQNHLDEFMRA